MPRVMSFALTTEQIHQRTKTVTRRVGWRFLKPGDLFWAVYKAQGLKRGEKARRLALLRCVSNTRERLDTITAADVRMEGFGEMTPAGFVEMFCRSMGGRPDQEVSRIGFKYEHD